MIEIDPIWQAETQQKMFRKLLKVMSEPGNRQDLAGELGGAPAYLGVLATVLDGTQSLFDTTNGLTREQWRFLEARQQADATADFILVNGKLDPKNLQPKCGSLSNPHESSTLVLITDQLGKGNLNLQLKGPGIKTATELSVSGLNQQWLEARNKWNAYFPLGVDYILTDKHSICALPRTTKLTIKRSTCHM